MNRSLRLLHLQRLLYRDPAGYLAADLARRLGVSKRTVERDLADLQADPFYLPLEQQEDWRWRLAEGHRFTLPPVQLSLQEAAALFLAARLLVHLSDEPNPYVGRALAALASVLPPEVAQPLHATASSRAADPDSPFARVFDVITLGWATGRKVHIRYRSLHSEHEREYDLCPYLVEPSGPGYAAYVIGHASYFDALRTFKLERIQEARLLAETFEVPADFDAVHLLGHAWGVMYGEETTEVLLRFTPAVARRVHETVWHPSQQSEETPDGGCLLRVQVAHPVEMKPWIRGWGPDCVVLAPAELRDEVAEEMRRAAEGYARADGVG